MEKDLNGRASNESIVWPRSRGREGLMERSPELAVWHRWMFRGIVVKAGWPRVVFAVGQAAGENSPNRAGLPEAK